ncbi:Pyruvate/2-oxoglutarate dehydrogenase complex, dihydrolipoamide dehydrogenase (E3) component [Lachnospiraceae bacterium NLAE-zl-G231]|nr:Pyruvate/2-oxoglutarate dehydrogenase complex, dihydrolipoamide dehydrogenase (E3) component [Lachnospiraceae bacterium NLAE-zl-G231]
MKEFDNIIIGFGKGGKTLAGALAAKGEKTALIERSDKMYGGTCINVACIPSKFLENSARLSAEAGGSFQEKAARYRRTIEEKRQIISELRQKNLAKAMGAGVEVITGTASFLDDHKIQVSYPDGTGEELYGKRIFINTGAKPFIPPIAGLKESRYAYTSEGMMELEELPERLLIIGGGYIGLEFASYYTNFGSKVTVIQDGERFIPREDEEVAASVLAHMTETGIRILRSSEVTEVKDGTDGAEVTVKTGDGEETLHVQAILVATGRRPNVEGLHPENAGIQLTKRGAIQTDEGLRTSVPHIWAMGDVAGGLQFTYISLDDSRIVKSQILGDGSRTIQNRGAVPYSVFLDPPLSRVGMTEKEAREAGFEVKVARMMTAAAPRARVLKATTGMLKAVIDAGTGQILGAHFYCAESHELINLIKLAMDAKIPYTVLRDNIYNHPTMSETFNDFFAAVN